MTIRYLLDTDTCVGWLRQNQAVRRRVADAGPTALGLSLMTLSELRYGAACSVHPDANHQAIDAFVSGIALIGLDPAIARQFGDTKALLRVQGQLIEDADLLIASTALTYQLILVTNNTNHFARIPDLILENRMLPLAS